MVFEGFWFPKWHPKVTETLQKLSKKASEGFFDAYWTQEAKTRNQERPNKAPKTTKTDQETEHRTKIPESEAAGALRKNKTLVMNPRWGGVGEGQPPPQGLEGGSWVGLGGFARAYPVEKGVFQKCTKITWCFNGFEGFDFPKWHPKATEPL